MNRLFFYLDDLKTVRSWSGFFRDMITGKARCDHIGIEFKASQIHCRAENTVTRKKSDRLFFEFCF